MSKRPTTEEFIEKSRKLHGDKYDYSKVDYINNKEKVIIICKKHGEFKQSPNTHLRGSGCRICSQILNGRKLSPSNTEFIEKAKKIHEDKYDYSLVEYESAHNKIKIICSIHGIFEQTPNTHLKNHGCPKCSGVFMDKNYFIEKSNIIHNNKYDYSKVNYIGNKTKVKIICTEHGIFEQTPNIHLKGCDCPECGSINRIQKRSSNTEEFIKKSKEIHRDKYDYSKVEYVNGITKVTIICPKHGEFKQKPQHHLIKHGCPKCIQSKGENLIQEYLTSHYIKFEPQKTFENCKYKNRLPFDFYLTDLNICVEYDGELHFRSIEYFGGDKHLKDTQRNDKIKTEYCEKNNIKLIRIKYDEIDNISSILNESILILI